MSISVQSSRRFFKSYFRTICFDILWSGVVFLWRSVHILWAEKEVQNHSHACRNTQTCQCLLVFWLCVWCKLKLTIYIDIYICFVRWYVLHILSAVQIEFAGSRVGGKKKIIEVIRENKLVHILSDGYLVYTYFIKYCEFMLWFMDISIDVQWDMTIQGTKLLPSQHPRIGCIRGLLSPSHHMCFGGPPSLRTMWSPNLRWFPGFGHDFSSQL